MYLCLKIFVTSMKGQVLSRMKLSLLDDETNPSYDASISSKKTKDLKCGWFLALKKHA